MARIRCDVRIKAAYRSIRPKLNTVGTVGSNFLPKKKNEDPANAITKNPSPAALVSHCGRRNPDGLILPWLTGVTSETLNRIHTFSSWTVATKSDLCIKLCGCRMRDNANNALGWPAVAFLLAIAVFGVVLIGQEPKWPIYASVLVWWGFVIFETVRK